MNTGIYQITNVVNRKVYIGSAVNISKRWAIHLTQLRSGLHHSPKLQRAWDKYGEAAFLLETLELCERQELIEREQRWLDKLSAAVSGYNVCPTAGSTAGRKFSDEAKKKMRSAKLGTKASVVTKERQSIARLGKRFSAEHCEKIRLAQKGKTIPESTRRAVSAANSARVHSAETLEKLRAASRKGVEMLALHKQTACLYPKPPKPIKPPNATCMRCGCEFRALITQLKRGRAKYCSQACYHEKARETDPRQIEPTAVRRIAAKKREEVATY